MTIAAVSWSILTSFILVLVLIATILAVAFTLYCIYLNATEGFHDDTDGSSGDVILGSIILVTMSSWWLPLWLERYLGVVTSEATTFLATGGYVIFVFSAFCMGTIGRVFRNGDRLIATVFGLPVGLLCVFLWASLLGA